MMHFMRATTTAFSMAGVFVIALHSASHVAPQHLPVTAPAMHATINVKMIGDGKGYRFEPSTITAKVGDSITFINVAGGPHNVTFWADSIPAGTAAALQADMPKTTAPLTSPLFEADGELWTMSTANLKPGTYKLFCLPHLPLSMHGQLVVQ